jgi:hypothetical protein
MRFNKWNLDDNVMGKLTVFLVLGKELSEKTEVPLKILLAK